MMQVNQGKANPNTAGILSNGGVDPLKRKSTGCQDEDSINEVVYAAQESLKEELATSVWQISRQNMRLLTVLGEGNFGKVWKAEAENICGYDGTVLVAVKTTKEKAPDKEKSDLLQEMQIMQKIGHHPNVVTLLGVSIDKGKLVS
jgi:serine/threonine protein kinase